MTFLLSSAFSAIGALTGGIRGQNIILWTLVIMALFNSTIDISQEWGVYHYYVGAKFFTELGYFDLYECSIDQPTTRRDLHTYGFRFDAPDCQANFTPERYREFKQDLQAVGFTPDMMRDKGPNMTPSWLVSAQILIDAGIATPQNVGVFDVIALTIAVGFLLWAFGWRTTGYVLLFILTFYGAQDRLWGHFMQWTWLAAVLVGVSMLHMNRHWGGFWLGVASALMIFPCVLMIHYWRNQRTLRYFVAGLMLMLIMGLFNSRGLDGYVQFRQNMLLHSRYLAGELCCNVGLQHTIVWTSNPTFDYRDCFASYRDCKPSYHPQLNTGYWFMLMPLVLTSPLGMMFGLLTLSRYYYLILAVIPLWYGERWARRLLWVNSMIILWMIADNTSGFILNPWLWFIFFTVLGAKNAVQAIQAVAVHTKQRLHPQTSAWNAGD